MHKPSLLGRVTELQAKHAGLGQKDLKLDVQPVIDTSQLNDIGTANRFQSRVPGQGDHRQMFGYYLKDGEETDYSQGLWTHSSLINHSCLPNCYRTFIGDLILLRANRPIVAGEEITMDYISTASGDRKERFREDWGFGCQCPLCVAEKKEDLSAARVREEANEVMLKLRDKSQSLNRYSDKHVRDARAALRKIHATYDRDVYKRATVRVSSYLMHAHTVRGEYNELLRELRDLFLAKGFGDVSFNGEDVALSATKNAVLAVLTPVPTLLTVEDSKCKRGETDAADALTALAKRFYVIWDGIDGGFSLLQAKRPVGCRWIVV